MATQQSTLDECLESLRLHIRSLKRSGIRFDASRKISNPPDQQSCLDRLESIRTENKNCKRCQLCKSRNHVIFGEGSSEARLMFIGDAPDNVSDTQGLAFAGEDGQLLTRIIEAIKLQRSQVYLTTIVKCIVPQGEPDDTIIEACLPLLQQQIEIIQPEIICTLGPLAARVLQENKFPNTPPRGKTYRLGSILIMPTHHPELLLRRPELKNETWTDVQEIQRILNATTPLRQ